MLSQLHEVQLRQTEQLDQQLLLEAKAHQDQVLHGQQLVRVRLLEVRLELLNHVAVLRTEVLLEVRKVEAVLLLERRVQAELLQDLRLRLEVHLLSLEQAEHLLELLARQEVLV